MPEASAPAARRPPGGMVRIAPSILSADFACLGDDINRVTPEADVLHVDVMDGHFVPNLTIGPPVVTCVRRHSDLYLDCHLMMDNPGKYLAAFRDAGANGCTVHVEIGGTDELLSQMRELGLDVGLAVNPETPFERCEPFLDRLDLLLVMTVHPGFGGQHFMSEVVPKIERGPQSHRLAPGAGRTGGGRRDRSSHGAHRRWSPARASSLRGTPSSDRMTRWLPLAASGTQGSSLSPVPVQWPERAARS